MSSFLLFGGCATRDIFDFCDTGNLKVEEYFARSGFASMCSDKVNIDIDLHKIESSFEKKCVARDLDKSFLEVVKNNRFDYLFFDFFSTRFDVAVNDKKIITLSDELIKTDYDFSSNYFRIVHNNTEEYFNYWKCGFERIMDLCQTTSIDHKLVLNKLYLADSTEDGRQFPDFFDKVYINNFNQLLSKFYDYYEQNVRSGFVFNYDPKLFVGSTKHKWGLNPFHFIDDFYIEALSKLKSLTK
jgi:hypothetical protein